MKRSFWTSLMILSLFAGCDQIVFDEVDLPVSEAIDQEPLDAPTDGSGETILVTEADFDQIVLRSKVPVLIDFWASWCGPCREMEPVIHSVARKYRGRAVVGQVNVDDNPNLAERFVVDSIPLLLVFQDGKIVWQSLGYTEIEELSGILDSVLERRASMESASIGRAVID